jgi:hypothetical protein
VFLDKAHKGVENDDGHDRQSVDPFFEESRDKGRPDQNPDHEIGELFEKNAEGRAAFLLAKLVGPVFFPAAGHSLFRQARMKIRFQLPGRRFRIQVPPFGHVRLFVDEISASFGRKKAYYTGEKVHFSILILFGPGGPSPEQNVLRPRARIFAAFPGRS